MNIFLSVNADRAMLRACVVTLAWLWLARVSTAAAATELHPMRAHAHTSHSKDIMTSLASIEDRLRALDTISAVQLKQARRLDVIQDKLDRMETTLSLRLERAQLAAERLEHRLHMLQTGIQATIKESIENLDRSQIKITEIAQNLTVHLDSHRHLLEKVSGAYVETWRRGLILESLMRDGLSLVNVTRRELADGLRALARRQRDARLTSTDLETAFTRRLNDNTYRIDLKMQEVLEAQKRFVDSCQRVQLDDPAHVADVLDKLIDSLINKTASTFRELQSIQVTMRNHDSKVMKLLSSSRTTQNDATCRRLESSFRNVSQSSLKEVELHQLTEKFVALTNRADSALQQLEARLGYESDGTQPESDVAAAADRLFSKLKGIKSEQDSEEDDWEEDEQEGGYFDDSGEADIMEEDRQLLSGAGGGEQGAGREGALRAPHMRHLHKHPYDRGPVTRSPKP